MSDALRPARRLTGSSRGPGLLRKIGLDQAGNVLPLMAMGMIVLAGLVGGGVDMGRAYMAERRLQAACDAGVLAGRRAVMTNGFDSTAEQQARAFFDANFDAQGQQTTNAVFEPTTPDNGNTINGTATAQMATVIMRIFGFDSLDLRVDCSASMGVGNSDIVMVLDNTYSMTFPAGQDQNGNPVNRIEALETAMKNFYTTVQTSVAGSNARIRYGFVPYGTAVNVGAILVQEDPSFLADQVTIQSRQAVNWTPAGEPYEVVGQPTNSQVESTTRIAEPSYTSLSQCNANKPADEANWTEDGGPVDGGDVAPFYDANSGQLVGGEYIRQYYRRYTYTCSSESVCTSYDRRGRCNGWTTRYYANRVKNRRYVTTAVYQGHDPVPVTAGNRAYANWLYKPVSYNLSGLKTYYEASNTFSTTQVPILKANGSKTTVMETIGWDGCIMERESAPEPTFTFVSREEGISPYTLDLDIDLPPSSDPATKWRPLVRKLTYTRPQVEASIDNGSDAIHSRYYCPYRSQLLAPMTREDFDRYAEAMQAQSYGTVHDLGLLWGARISSPFGIFADNVNEEPGNGGNVSRHLIFMTDGELDPPHPSSSCGSARYEVNTTYGVERLDRRITGNGSASNICSRHRSRYLAICEAIKARGVRLWVIAFGTALSSDLRTCGSPNSSFQADNAVQLDQHFQEIAKQVGELRIVQ